jgi:hypothetical protein
MTDLSVSYAKNDFLYYKYAFDEFGKERYNCQNDDPIKSGTVLRLVCDANPELKNSGAPGPCNPTFSENLCKNKTSADRLLQQKVNHSGSDELYQNTTDQYNVERLNTINLGIGIVMCSIFLLKFRA